MDSLAVHTAKGERDQQQSLLRNRLFAVLAEAIAAVLQTAKGLFDLSELSRFDFGQASSQIIGGVAGGFLDDVYHVDLRRHVVAE